MNKKIKEKLNQIMIYSYIYVRFLFTYICMMYVYMILEMFLYTLYPTAQLKWTEIWEL